MKSKLNSIALIAVLAVGSMFCWNVYAHVAQNDALAATSPRRDSDITIEEIRDNGLIARFYSSAERRPRTTILMLAGSGGGFPDDAAARDLAMSGYRVLGLA